MIDGNSTNDFLIVYAFSSKRNESRAENIKCLLFFSHVDGNNDSNTYYWHCFHNNNCYYSPSCFVLVHRMTPIND